MAKKTFWEALQKLPASTRTRLRVYVARHLHITDSAVLKHMQEHSFSAMKTLYQEKVGSDFEIDHTRIKDNSDIIFNEDFQFFTVETPEDGVGEELVTIQEGGEHE